MPKNAPRWIERSTAPSEILPPRELEHRLVEVLGRDKIRNVVVARVPDDRADVGRTAWLAPYASFARGAAVVLVHAGAAAVAEADVRELIGRIVAVAHGDRACRLHVDRLPQRGSRSQPQRRLANSARFRDSAKFRDSRGRRWRWHGKRIASFPNRRHGRGAARSASTLHGPHRAVHPHGT